MSRNEIKQLNQDGLAFEYVTGVLRDKERESFAARLQRDSHLQKQVQFWEEQLIHLSDTVTTHNPNPGTWPRIEQRITTSLNSTTNKSPATNWHKWLYWVAPNLLTAIAVSCLFLFIPHQKNAQPNTDYVAVLTSDQGAPVLSALTGKTKNSTGVMWLKWEKITITPDKNMQLWAISKRDGQARSISVFTKTDSGQISISKANLHLVKEAASLILTEEDIGGSALDEPSEKIIAKGACVLVTPEQNTI